MHKALEFNTYDDGSFSLVEPKLSGHMDPTICFGPLSTKLSSLYSFGFTLRSYGGSTRTGLIDKDVPRKLHLENTETGERYLIGKICLRDIIQFGLSLSDYVDDEVQMIKRAAGRTHDPELPVERDPWDILKQRYPQRRTTIMIGNQTVAEYVKSMLN